MPAYYRATGCYLTGTVPVRCPQPCPFTAAGLLVLCRRARISSGELSSELLLTLLWIIESCESQCECGWAGMHEWGDGMYGVRSKLNPEMVLGRSTMPAHARRPKHPQRPSLHPQIAMTSACA